MRRRTAPLIALIALAGCAPAITSSPTCPPVPAYPQPLLDRAADELELLPPASAIEGLLDDYGIMRRQARVCAGAAR